MRLKEVIIFSILTFVNLTANSRELIYKSNLTVDKNGFTCPDGGVYKFQSGQNAFVEEMRMTHDNVILFLNRYLNKEVASHNLNIMKDVAAINKSRSFDSEGDKFVQYQYEDDFPDHLKFQSNSTFGLNILKISKAISNDDLLYAAQGLLNAKNSDLTDNSRFISRDLIADVRQYRNSSSHLFFNTSDTQGANKHVISMSSKGENGWVAYPNSELSGDTRSNIESYPDRKKSSAVRINSTLLRSGLSCGDGYVELRKIFHLMIDASSSSDLWSHAYGVFTTRYPTSGKNNTVDTSKVPTSNRPELNSIPTPVPPAPARELFIQEGS